MKNDDVNEAILPDRITYWESRSINIGHYDNTQFGISYAKNINLKDKTIKISAKRESSSEELEDSMKFVTEALDKKEAFIREKSDSYVDHDSIEKISDDDLKYEATERRNAKRAKSNAGAQDFKDRRNKKIEDKEDNPTRGSRLRNREKKFLDQ